MKKLAVTQLINFDVEIRFVEYSDGSYTRIENEEEVESSFDELQELINTGLYDINELDFCA